MTQINYKAVRDTLKHACQRYSAHKNNQLSTLKAEAPIHPKDMFYEEALGTTQPGPGFTPWASCKYTYLFGDIVRWSKLNHRTKDKEYYEENYPPCRGKMTYCFEEPFYDPITGEHKDSELNEDRLFDRLNVLTGLIQFVIVDEEERDFDQRWNEYQQNNPGDFIYSDSDPVSVKAYKELMTLQSLIRVVATFDKYHKHSTYLLHYLNDALPTFEGYIKRLAVDELTVILKDKDLTNEQAVHAVVSQYNHPVIAALLEKNHQSDTEYQLKMLSVLLIAVGIGIIPTVCLAAKRLYDSGGTSMNFFKPLSQNLCEDIESLTANMQPAY